MSLPDYIVHFMIPFHCKRGYQHCKQCGKLYEEGEKYCVLHLFYDEEDPPVSRPVISLNVDGKEFFVEFEFVKCFSTRSEAEEFLEMRTSVLD